MAIAAERNAVKIYTEYDAQRRAEEIASERLANITDQIAEITANMLSIIKSNQLLTAELQQARKSATRYVKACIAYEEIYEHLPADIKSKYREIEKEVLSENDYFKEGE